MDPETPYVLPGGEKIWVIDTAAAAEHLPQMIERLRDGEPGPFIVGDAGQPEAVVIPWNAFRRLAVLAAETDDFEHVYGIASERLASNEPSIPIEDVAAEIGWHLNEPIDDSDLPKK